MIQVRSLRCSINLLATGYLCVGAPLASSATLLNAWPLPSASVANKPKDGAKILRAAFKTHRTEFFVRFHCTVLAVLPDDTEGSPHQHFIVKTSTGQTLLIAHNLDLAARIQGLRKGSLLTILGEYIWSEEGGIVHETHPATNSTDPDGWIRKR